MQLTAANLGLHVLRDYKALHLQLEGVRQNAIRNSNTKHRAGTLPKYAYIKPDPPVQSVDFQNRLGFDEQHPLPTQTQAPEASEIPENDNILYMEGSLLLMATDSSTEIKMAKCKSPISVHQENAPATIYTNSDLDPYNMILDGEDVIKCSEIVRELIIVEMPTLSELEYNSIVDDGKCIINSVHEELEDLQAQALENPEPMPETLSVTRSGRRSKPTRHKDLVMW